MIGEVGHRLFLFYCRQGLTETTVKVEKQQIAVLAGYLGRIVKELGRPGHLPEDLEFYGTEEFEWVVGTIGVSYDEELDRIIVVLEEVGVDDEDEDDEDDAESGHVLRVALTREQAAAFAIHATRLVEAGRPPCPLCSLPLDPAGHDCPRTNGHRPPVTLSRGVRRHGRARPHRGRDGGARPHRRQLERHAARHLPARRRGAARRLQAVTRASGRCGTSPAGCSAARWRPTSSRSALGWGLVPETVERAEGPFGPGSVQRFVHEDGTSHYFTLRDDPKWHPTLMRLCAFDVVANNADRKSGHVLLAEDRLWAIDNGLCFNVHDKLRTVIWDFGGAPLEPAVQEDLARLAHERPAGARCASCSSRPRWRPRWTASPGSSACGPCPSWSTTGSGPPTPGPWSEPAPAPPDQAWSRHGGPGRPVEC